MAGGLGQSNQFELESALIKPAYKMLMAAQDNDSDSSGTRRRNKKIRKQARKMARDNRELIKEEDPFLYYFGKVD